MCTGTLVATRYPSPDTKGFCEGLLAAGELKKVALVVRMRGPIINVLTP